MTEHKLMISFSKAIYQKLEEERQRRGYSKIQETIRALLSEWYDGKRPMIR